MAEVATYAIHALVVGIAGDFRRPAGRDADLPDACRGMRRHMGVSDGDGETVSRRLSSFDRRFARIEHRLDLTTEPAN